MFVLLAVVTLAAGGFLFAMVRFQESPGQVWDRIVVKLEGWAESLSAPRPRPEPAPAPPPAPAPVPQPVTQSVPPPVPVPSPEPVPEPAPEEVVEPAPPPVSIDPLTWLVQNRNRWPADITLLTAVDFTVTDQGKVVGSMTMPAGSHVRLVSIDSNSDIVTVNQGPLSRKVPVIATDLRERAKAIMATPLPVFAWSYKPRSEPAAAGATRTWTGFVHPGLLHTKEDLDRMRDMVRAKRSPWIEGWEKLASSDHAQLGWRPRPAEAMIRGAVPGQNSSLFFNDAHAAYQLALRWKISGDTRYAEKSIEILNAWSSKLKGIGGNADRFLAAGIYGYVVANAAEIMRTYPGWNPSDFKRFQTMMLEVFYPVNQTFLLGRNGGKDHNGAAITNYWANWDLCNIDAMQAIGVLCDRKDIYDDAINYFKTGGGNGALDKMVYYVHDGNLGQWQEAGRDQGHTTLGIALAGPILETAWNQGEDLYSYRNNLFLAAAEYVAKYNLGHDVPFMTYSWGSGPRGDFRQQTTISGGQGTFRAGYELVINHYVNRRGIAAPYSEQYAARLRPEDAPHGHASSFDQMGLGTLTETRLPEVAHPVPGGLTVIKRAGAAVLSWWGAAGADSYNVKRGLTSGGLYTTVATGVKDPLVWTDHAGGSGDAFYIVTGVIDGRETAPSNEVRFSRSTVPTLHLPFDESHGTQARDLVSKNNAATLHEAQWTRCTYGGAVSLNGKKAYVSLPVGVVSGLSDFTISAWVYLDETPRWARIFDFGDDRGQWLCLTPNGGDGKPRFMVATVYNYNEQHIDASEDFPLKQWVHIAVSLSGTTGSLYLNGAMVGANPQIDFPPFRLGATPRNWIGRSQFESDPFLDGKVADFRIYDGALTQAEISALARAGAGH